MVTKLKSLALLAAGTLLLIACNNSQTSDSGNRPSTDTIVEETAVVKQDDVSALFKTETGEVIDTRDLVGKVVFINFWATWCPPCVKEMPSIQSLYNKFKDNKEVVFLIVDVESDVEGTKQFLVDNKLTLPISYRDGNIPEEWLGGAIPTTVILDKKGKIAARQEGMYDFSTKESADFIQNLVDQ